MLHVIHERMFFCLLFVWNLATIELVDILQMFEFYERVSGARMHAAYVRPGGVHQVRFD